MKYIKREFILKLILLFILSNQLFGLEIKEKKTFQNLLENSKIYIDKNNSLTIKDIQKLLFVTNTQKSLGFGYSPNLTVWIKFKLENKSDKQINKIIEYANPLTTDVIFFDLQSNQIYKDGLTHTNPNRESLNPIFPISLEPHSSKTFYIKAHSHITTLIINLYIWSINDFYKHEIKYQFILALFFGAMGIVIFYNLLIYFSTKEISYLYYVLFFIGITFHHAVYKGIINLYLLSPKAMETIIEFSSLIVAFPIFFLAFFIKSILDLKQYPIWNKILNYYLILFPLLIVTIYWLNLYSYRNIFSIILLIFLFIITCYAFFKKNRQAYFIIFGWFLFVISTIFMYLSSLGIYDIFYLFPYYTETSLVAEALIFSLSLSNKIKQLHREKIILKENLIQYQKEEKKRLSLIVEEKTIELSKSLEEKDLLLKELNHRVKNSIQTIVSFLRLQIDNIKEKQIQQLLMNIQNRIMSISHLYALLYTKENICFVNTHEYFSLLIDDIETSYDMPHIKIRLKTETNIPSEYAIYCGFILNELITNSLQHAFIGRESGYISIHLKKDKNVYKLLFYDNGIGYNKDINNESLGMIIIETLVLIQLQGSLKIDSTDGTKIEIEWKDNG